MTTPQPAALPEPELGYIKTDKSNQPAFSARQMRAALQSQPAAFAPTVHIKEPYTLAELNARIASNDYNAELLLQHAMLLLNAQPAAAGVSDAELRKAIDALRDPGTVSAFYNGYYTLKPDELRRAILALRPQAVPTDEQIVDWLCEEAQHTCGQWQVVIESDNPSFIDAVKEHAARAHGITAQGAQGEQG